MYTGRMADEKKLTIKQELFIAEYMKDFNASKAAQRAGYSKKTAHVIGPENLLKPVIKSRIEEKKKALVKKIDISAEAVLQEIGKIAMANSQDYFDEAGELIFIHELTREQAAAISDIEMEQTINALGEVTTKRKHKRWNKDKSLDMLAKYHNLYSGENSDQDDEEMDEVFL